MLAMLSALLFAAKVAFEALPNIHPVGMLIMVYTVVYRVRALIPLYIFVLIFGLYYGFSIWWIPYIYIWTILWAMTMLIPKDIPTKTAVFVYPLICGLYGFAYGTLYAPAQAILFDYDFKTTIAWIMSGLPFDVLHGIGNIGMGILILPLSKVLMKLNKTKV